MSCAYESISMAFPVINRAKIRNHRLVKWHKKREMAFFMIFYILGKA